MKKSEMIEKIYQKSLNDDRFRPEQKKSEKEVVLHVIDYVITLAEELGMLPPKVLVDNKNTRYTGEKTAIHFTDSNGWEPEN